MRAISHVLIDCYVCVCVRNAEQAAIVAVGGGPLIVEGCSRTDETLQIDLNLQMVEQVLTAGDIDCSKFYMNDDTGGGKLPYCAVQPYCTTSICSIHLF